MHGTSARDTRIFPFVSIKRATTGLQHLQGSKQTCSPIYKDPNKELRTRPPVEVRKNNKFREHDLVQCSQQMLITNFTLIT